MPIHIILGCNKWINQIKYSFIYINALHILLRLAFVDIHTSALAQTFNPFKWNSYSDIYDLCNENPFNEIKTNNLAIPPQSI